jgi:hypothetical protein
MGQIITTIAAATDALRILCPPESDPELDEAAIVSLLANAKLASVWVASTTYNMGEVVMPTVRNSRRYRLVAFDGTGVTSGLTEPSWPAPNVSSNDYPVWGMAQPNPVVGWWRNAVVTDNAITWQEDGADYDSLWDIQVAAFNGWMLKAGRAICAVDLSSGQMKQSQSQIYDHCLEMAQRYAPVMVA